MNCLCGKELSGGLDTYGPTGSEQCWECFCTGGNHSSIEEQALAKCRELRDVDNEIDDAKDTVKFLQYQAQELYKNIQAFLNVHPSMKTVVLKFKFEEENWQ